MLIHNLAPGAMARLGFASSALHEQHPRLVVCEISGYGTDGPYRDKKAYDLLVQSEAGLLSITGTPDVPSKVGVSIADIAAGMYAFSGILAALLRRARTGAGAVLDVSMFDALAEWMGYPAYYTGYGGAPLPRSGAAHAAIAPYGPYTAGDGKVVYLGLQNEREWARFCADVLEQPALATDPRFSANADRVAHREALDALITRVVRDALGRAGPGPPRRRADRQRAHEHRRRSFSITRSWPRATGGGRWIHPQVRFARSCRRSGWMMSSRRWGRSPPSASTPTRFSTSSATTPRPSRSGGPTGSCTNESTTKSRSLEDPAE